MRTPRWTVHRAKPAVLSGSPFSRPSSDFQSVRELFTPSISALYAPSLKRFSLPSITIQSVLNASIGSVAAARAAGAHVAIAATPASTTIDAPRLSGSKAVTP